MLTVQRLIFVEWSGGRISEGLNEAMDNKANAVKDIARTRLRSKESGFSLKPGSSNKLEFQEIDTQSDINVQDSKPGTFKGGLNGNNDDRIGTSGHACTSSRRLDHSDVMVEELTVKNLNSGKLEIVGELNREDISELKPGVWEDSNSIFFSKFLDNKQGDQNQNGTGDSSPLDETQPSPSDSLLSPGSIRTKILSKSGFSEYFVKNTLKGKGVTFRGPARDVVSVHLHGQSDPLSAVVDSTAMGRETSLFPTAGILEPWLSVSSNNKNTSLREWLNSGRNKVDKSKSLYIFKQILNLVDSSHSQGVVLHALRPSCFRLLPSHQILYLGSPSIEESTETNVDEEMQSEQGVFGASQLSKKHKHGENWNSFGMWSQFYNHCDSNYGTSQNTKARMGGIQDSGYGFSEESVSVGNKRIRGVSSLGGDLLEEQWYASPEELKERRSTLSSNIYSLGVFLFELLGSFESAREHASAMMNLRQRILPANFLSENPKEAGYCLWLLHPEALARPTTSDILQSKLASEIEEISTDKLLSSIAQEDDESELLLHFLASLKEENHNCTTKLLGDINCLQSDISDVESRRANTSLVISGKPKQYCEYRENRSYQYSSSGESRLINNLSQLETSYFFVRSHIEVSEGDKMDPADHKVLTSRENDGRPQNIKEEKKPLDRLGIFFNGLCKYARYSKFEVCGNLRSGDFSSSANVICSLGFDRDEDYFATAGVSKKIKVYDFDLLLDDSIDIHYPAIEMPNKSKLSCICWNSYIKNYLASTDYDGIVKLWDVGNGEVVSHHTEHERRAWSVDFSKLDPTKLVSGSDDCYVKLWSINEKKSLSTIKNMANVCCVQFSPYSAHLLAFGSADYRTYCYDLRNISTPLCILAGHDRAVSYVKFLDSETLVSASTDNTLKLWDLKKTSFGCISTNGCGLTFRGHTNEKNFVGLSVADGYIACGSETNEVFAYYRSLPMPIASHKFGSIDPVSGKETDHTSNQFVSSVCWRKKSGMVLAANSSGCLKLLQMV